MESRAVGPLELRDGDLGCVLDETGLPYQRRCVVIFSAKFLMEQAESLRFPDFIESLALRPCVHPYYADWNDERLELRVWFTGSSPHLPPCAEGQYPPAVDLATLQDLCPNCGSGIVAKRPSGVIVQLAEGYPFNPECQTCVERNRDRIAGLGRELARRREERVLALMAPNCDCRVPPETVRAVKAIVPKVMVPDESWLFSSHPGAIAERLDLIPGIEVKSVSGVGNGQVALRLEGPTLPVVLVDRIPTVPLASVQQKPRSAFAGILDEAAHKLDVSQMQQAAEALRELDHARPDTENSLYRFGRKHAERREQAAQAAIGVGTLPCPECRGTGKYTGLTAIEDCQACEGSGRA